MRAKSSKQRCPALCKSIDVDSYETSLNDIKNIRFVFEDSKIDFDANRLSSLLSCLLNQLKSVPQFQIELSSVSCSNKIAFQHHV